VITSDEFVVPRSLRITKITSRIGKGNDIATETHFICWRPDRSAGCITPEAALRFAKWPASTPTGKELREWLGITPKPVAAEPNDDTRTII
jgi:hypothetical protein